MTDDPISSPIPTNCAAHMPHFLTVHCATLAARWEQAVLPQGEIRAGNRFGLSVASAYHSWVADPAVEIIGELEASFKKYPPIKLGTLDPIRRQRHLRGGILAPTRRLIGPDVRIGSKGDIVVCPQLGRQRPHPGASTTPALLWKRMLEEKTQNFSRCVRSSRVSIGARRASP